MAPFALVAPVLGPYLDRSKGGRRLLFAGASLGRAVICLLMADHIHSLLLFPLAFFALVLSKGQSIAKSSLVPSVVDDETQLVLANSRLAIISVVAGLIGGIPAAAILKLASGAWVLRMASLVFVGAALAAWRIPRAQTLAPDETPSDR